MAKMGLFVREMPQGDIKRPNDAFD